MRLIQAKSISIRKSRNFTFSTCSRIRAAPGCMSDTRKVTPPPTSSRDARGCADLMFCIRWVGTRSVCPRSNTRSKAANTPRLPRVKMSRNLKRSLSASVFRTIGSAKSTRPIRAITNGRSGFSCRFTIPGLTPRVTKPSRSRPIAVLIPTAFDSLMSLMRQSTGVRNSAPFWRTRKLSMEKARLGAFRSSGDRCANGCCGSRPMRSDCLTNWTDSTGRKESSYSREIGLVAA